MIDKSIIRQLDSPDPEERKSAIKALARSNNPEALKYLAVIVRQDKDPEVANMARKAGAYIRKNTGGETVGADRLAGQSAAPVYPDRGEQEDYEPLPEEIRVSEADMERAKGLVQQALDAHMRENNDRAAQYLTRAFTLNPKLRYDSYTVGLASTVTGLSSTEALRVLLPTREDLRRRTGRAQRAVGTPTHRLLAFVMLLASVVLLVSYLLFPWVDLSPLPTTNEFGQTITIGQAMDQLEEQMNALTGVTGGANVPQMDRLMAAVRGINIDFSGLETTMLTLGLRDILDVMGLRAFLEVLADMAGFDSAGLSEATTPANPAPLDITLLLIPAVGVIVLLVGMTLVARGGFSVGLWVVAILFGLGGLVPFWWFYTDASGALLDENANLGMLGQVGINSAVQLISLGFWVGLVAQLAILFLPFIALMLSGPAAQEERLS